MKTKPNKRTLTALATVGFISLANLSALAAELSGTVQGNRHDIHSTVDQRPSG